MQSKYKRHIVVAIRYSLLLNGKDSWKIGKENDFDSYKATLFDHERLKVRQNLFKNLTLKSLVNIYKNKPDDVEFSVYILTSEELPYENKVFLHRITDQYNFIKVNYYTPSNASLSSYFTNDYYKKIQSNEMYANVRLDDDDALSLSWLETTLSYMKSDFDNFIISLSGGYAVLVDNEASVQEVSHYKWHFASAGLTYIGMKKDGNEPLTAYQCGSHTRTDEKFPTILDSRGKYFFRTYNGFNDSNDKFPSNLISKDNISQALLDFGVKI